MSSVRCLARSLMQLVCIVVLLTAQQAALTHEIGHLYDRVPVQSLQPKEGKQGTQAASCNFHVVFAEVLGGVSSPALTLRLAANGVERSTNHFPPAFPADLVVPASRGPPILL